MFLKTQITKSTVSYWQEISRVQAQLQVADAVVIGAGAGLSAAAGFAYEGERFTQHFSDFAKKYGFKDMYTGSFYPFATPEEHWAYWSRLILINRYMDAPKPVYDALYALVKGKDYFVLSTNVDHCFQKAGFDKQRLFYTQGDYGLFQCVDGCNHATWDNEIVVREMVAQQKNGKIPTALVPTCPVCGKPATMNLRADDGFVEDAGWHAAAERYTQFLDAKQRKRVVFIELGVGYNTPGIIKYPFWQMVANNPQATYVCINNGQATCPEEIIKQSICINSDITAVLHLLKQGV